MQVLHYVPVSLLLVENKTASLIFSPLFFPFFFLLRPLVSLREDFLFSWWSCWHFGLSIHCLIMYTFAGFLKRGGGLDLKNTFDQYGRPDRPKYEHKTDTMFAKRTITRPTTEYGSSKRKGWTGVCGLNPSIFRNTTDRNSIMKSCYLYTCPVPLWPDIRHFSRMDNGYRKGPKLQRHVPAWGRGWESGGGGGGWARYQFSSFRVPVEKVNYPPSAHPLQPLTWSKMAPRNKADSA